MEKESFFMVFVEGENSPAVKHLTIDIAEMEAKRLAKETKKKATVLCSIKSFKLIEITVIDERPSGIDDLPF